MPIRIPDQLPARDILVREGVMVMDDTTALRQDIRPLQIALLNLMPNKIKTETQIARLIGTTPLQVELTLVRIGGHQPKNTPELSCHMLARPRSDAALQRHDLSPSRHALCVVGNVTDPADQLAQ